jgi:hypothetical protein
MKTFEEFAAWTRAVEEECGDAAAAVCQMFFHWSEHPEEGELTCGPDPRGIVLTFKPPTEGRICLPLKTGEPIFQDGEVETFGAEQITAGVWALDPSVNIPMFVHGFVVLFGVPEPAPWENVVVIAHTMPQSLR